MAALQLKVDSISSEVSQISDALRGYLDHGIASGRRLQPPKTKAGRDLLQHLLGRLDQVSTGLIDVRHLAAPQLSLSPPPPCGPDAPSPAAPVVQQQQTEAAIQQPQAVAASGQQADQPDAQRRTIDEPPPLALVPTASSLASPEQPLTYPIPHKIRLKDGSVYNGPIPSRSASPLFDCTYQDIHILNEELFELYSSHPAVRDLGYFKLQVRGLPPLNVQKVASPSKDHATSFSYKVDHLGLVKVDTGKRFKFASPRLPLPMSTKMAWSLEEQRDLWNSTAVDPPQGTQPYIIGNPLFVDVVLSPGEKLRRRGRAVLEGINTQYVYFNLTGKTITTMHREDAHVRSENLLRSGQHKFWCFVKPAFAKKLEERMALEYPEMRRCSQAVRHLSRHIPPSKLDEWGIEYTLDYCVPGQAVVTEPGTYHQVLNLGPNYAIAINLEYNSSPDMPIDYRFCDKFCPDKFAISADDFRIYDDAPSRLEEELMPRTPETTGSHEGQPTDSDPPDLADLALLTTEPTGPQVRQPATPPPETAGPENLEPAGRQAVRSEIIFSEHSMPAGPQHDASSRHSNDAGIPLPQMPQFPQDSPIEPESTDAGSAAPSLTTMRPTPGSRSQPSVQPSRQTQQLSSTAASTSVEGQPTPAQYPAPRPPSGPAEPLAAPPIQQLQQQNRGDVPASSYTHFVPTRQPPLASMLPGPFEPSASAPAQQPGHLLPSPTSVPEPCAHAIQIISSRLPVIPTEFRSRFGGFWPMANGPPPIRKTARLIKRDQEPDTPPPVPLKKQRVDNVPFTPAQGPATAAPADRLAALLRSREMKGAGSAAAEKLSGKPAFERLAHLVREWRRYSKSTPVVLGGFKLVKSVEETAHGFPELHTFLSRFFKMKVASCIVKMTSRPGRPSPQQFLDGVLQMLGWPGTNQHKLHDYLREGSCWATICGSFDGLLCLIPPESDCLDLAIFKDELVRFHSDLNNDFVRRLCAVGDILQKSIWECLELPEFIWESATTTWLTVDRILPFLAPFRLLKSNHFDPSSGPNWTRPDGWRWDWPSDPSRVSPSDRQCDLCTRKSCRCAETKVPQVPRISDDGSKGPGIRSVGDHRTNDILGELVGELVPHGARASEWTISLRRPDLDGQPVADIYPGRMGNWVRKVGHSTTPSAAFRVMKLSGRWRQMLVAAKDIRDGEEITAKYGKGFRKEQPYSLVEGL